MKIELLPVSRWTELQRALNESRSDEQLPKPEHSIMLAAVDGSDIIGCIGAEKVWLVSPFWARKDQRGNGLAKDLAVSLSGYNDEKLREVCATTSSHVEKLIFSMGFIPIQGQLWRRNLEEVR
jgi:hypothetical protein